ncbi:MAG: TIGR03546 family protein [Endomicrobia bacterium]|nr:TIGR03546 family protein [Endomicrobiia bacterium]
MIPLKVVKSIIQFLHSNISPIEIALGFGFGVIAGLLPTGTLLSFFLLICVIILNVNFSAFLLSTGLFKLIAYIIDPVAHRIGYFLLVKLDFMENIWTSLYNMPIIPFTRFYNTVVLGSFVIGILLFIPTVVVVQKFIVFYRKNLAYKVEQLKIVKLIKLSSWYDWYNKLKS